MPDGTGSLIEFPGSASPGASNYLVAGTTLLLNEVLARAESYPLPDASQPVDWIELVNVGSAAVDLSGHRLSVGERHPGNWTFPDGVTVPAGGYLIVRCDPSRPASTSRTPALNLGQALDDAGDSVYWFDSQNRLLDAIEFGFALPDQSIGGERWLAPSRFSYTRNRERCGNERWEREHGALERMARQLDRRRLA